MQCFIAQRCKTSRILKVKSDRRYK
ncbi:hypothetical protein MTR67_052306 [Solanum verrucosum]|uniref:Ribosomal protein L36 n=1 Tax=Solanum verrucosum TaxID=315347 RepID=A0AAF1A0X6_SOLVR|nr:hypothetical protein MTR67_052306 [Solanum verrucosum]